MKGLREFFVCRNCLLAHPLGDGVECGNESIPGLLLPADWRCSHGQWAVDINGSRNMFPITALVLDEETPAYTVEVPMASEETPGRFNPDTKAKILQFLKDIKKDGSEQPN